MKAFVGSVDHARVVEAIRRAEARSTGEVRVHVSSQRVVDAETAAARQFEALGMTATRERNGVLVYVAPLTQKFAVIGDSGVDARAGSGFWREAAAEMTEHFRGGRFTEGLVRVVDHVGEVLAAHFPRPEGHQDKNELSDEVSED